MPAGEYSIELVGIVCVGTTSPVCTAATAGTQLTIQRPALYVLVNGFPEDSPITLLAPSTDVFAQVEPPALYMYWQTTKRGYPSRCLAPFNIANT